MKILKIKVSGFRLLKDDFEINFLTKARVYEADIDDEVLELEPNLYIPTTTALVGRNSSGKTTVLDLYTLVFEIFKPEGIDIIA